MGDRHNIGLIQYDRDPKVPENIMWLYSHSGFWLENPHVDGFSACLAVALDEARPRWTDHTYFNRIVIHTLGEAVRGIGIGTATGDEHKRWVVDNEKKEVYLMDNWSWDGSLAKMPEPIFTLGFEAFIAKYRKHEAPVRNEY